MTANANNQTLGKKRQEMYVEQTKLAAATTEAERKTILAKLRKLDKELRELVEKFDPTRQYCNDNKCSEMKSLTTKTHIKHLP